MWPDAMNAFEKLRIEPRPVGNCGPRPQLPASFEFCERIGAEREEGMGGF